MLDNLTAQKLVDKIMKQLGYNINIMNEKGIIVASGDSTRIGDFHEIAYKIIKNKLDIEVIRPDDEVYIGVKPGVNMPIMYENRIIGVIGISGEPEKIMDFAYIVKMSVETLIEYEFYKEQITKRQNDKNVFLNSLLYEEPINAKKIATLAEELGYNPNLIRVPILLKTALFNDNEQLIKVIKRSPSHSRQDMSFPLADGNFIVFKSIETEDVKNYKHKLLRYIHELTKLIETEFANTQCFYFVGTPQNQLINYRYAFHHSQWLEKHFKADAKGSSYFFMDYLSHYIQDMVPFETYQKIFSIYESPLDDIDQETIIETLEALYENNMNINKTAEQLYLHRNTVFFRLNKIKEQFGINPIKNIGDNQFLNHLLYYYKNRRRKS